jgi:NAD+ synthase (glutamine-hydrolysing)
MDLRIAIAQINPTVGDLRGNTSLALQSIRRAKRERADLVAFPELALTGYPPRDLLLKAAFVQENRSALESLAPECDEIACIIGFVDSSPLEHPMDGYDPSSPYYRSRYVLHNSAAFIKNGKVWGVQHKSKLPTYDVFDERRYFEPAREWNLFEVCSTRVAVNICEDLWVDDGPISRQARMGADLVVTISASPFYAGKLSIRTELLEQRSTEHSIPILYVNMVGGQDDLVFDGGSCLFSSQGEQLYLCKRFCEDFVVVDETKESTVTPPEDMVSEVCDALVLGIKDYVRKNSFEEVILGLSGGIDSAVTAALAVRALGADNVRGVMMPSEVSSPSSLEDAQVLALNLGVKTSVIPINEIYDSYIRTLRKEFENTSQDVTEENIQARIRGNILMALSNKFGHLPLTTGNKSEMAVGYVTLYGDLAGGLAPLSDVAKTTVYKLAAHVNERAGRELIPRAIIDKPPSAELKPGQKDSDDLPDYEVLDQILHAYIEEGKSKAEIVQMGFESEAVEDVIRRADRSEHKRKQAPTGIKITPKAFGFGRRMPITNKYST